MEKDIIKNASERDNIVEVQIDGLVNFGPGWI